MQINLRNLFPDPDPKPSVAVQNQPGRKRLDAFRFRRSPNVSQKPTVMPAGDARRSGEQTGRCPSERCPPKKHIKRQSATGRLQTTPPDAAERGRWRQHQGAARTSVGPAIRAGRGRAAGAPGEAGRRTTPAGPRERGPTGTGRAGPGSGGPSGRTYAASPARPAPPDAVTAPRPRAPQRPASPHKANPLPSRAAPRRATRPLTGGSTAALALPPAPNDERRPPPAARTVTSGVTRLPLSRAGSPCACVGRGRGFAPSPFCSGPRGRVSRGLAASRLLWNV